MEWVDAACRVRAVLSDGCGDRLGHVARHEFELGAAFFSQEVQELFDRLAVTAGCRPDQAATVVVDDYGQVVLAPAV